MAANALGAVVDRRDPLTLTDAQATWWITTQGQALVPDAEGAEDHAPDTGGKQWVEAQGKGRGTGTAAPAWMFASTQNPGESTTSFAASDCRWPAARRIPSCRQHRGGIERNNPRKTKPRSVSATRRGLAASASIFDHCR